MKTNDVDLDTEEKTWVAKPYNPKTVTPRERAAMEVFASRHGLHLEDENDAILAYNGIR